MEDNNIYQKNCNRSQGHVGQCNVRELQIHNLRVGDEIQHAIVNGLAGKVYTVFGSGVMANMLLWVFELYYGQMTTYCGQPMMYQAQAMGRDHF
jgi:hypothetical protein